MADPQLKDGYTRIANEILEALMQINLSPYERRFLDCVLRYTYGFSRKEATLSLKFLAIKTRIDYRHCQRAKRNLVKMQIIKEKKKDGLLTFSFQKDYSKWDIRLKRRINPEGTARLFGRNTPKQATPKEAHIKENIPKDNTILGPKGPLKKEIKTLAIEMDPDPRIKYGWQHEALRMAKALEIKFPDKKTRTRWMGLFKEAYQKKRQGAVIAAYSYTIDNSKLKTSKDRMAAFIWKALDVINNG